jgi:hypothetical protein
MNRRKWWMMLASALGLKAQWETPHVEPKGQGQVCMTGDARGNEVCIDGRWYAIQTTRPRTYRNGQCPVCGWQAEPWTIPAHGAGNPLENTETYILFSARFSGNESGIDKRLIMCACCSTVYGQRAEEAGDARP